MEFKSLTMTNELNEKILLLVLMLVVCLSSFQGALADEHREDENRYDGSEFNASSFNDDNFGKTDYKELKSGNSAVSELLRENMASPKDSTKLMRKHSEKDGITEAGKKEDKSQGKSVSNRIMSEERTGPVRDLPGDWVPDKIDLTSNGGFGIAPDNGSPVPYRLNGHVDIQRGRP